jgi:hypothetical protein
MVHSAVKWCVARRRPVVRRAFDERRATQMAARFLSKKGGRMPEIVLVKYMYVADREALRMWGYPLVWDTFFSLPAGPIQSCVLNLASGKVRTCDGSGYWRDHIVTEHVRGEEKEVPVCVLKNATDDDSLPEDVSDLIDRIWDEYKRKNIVKVVHALPEFREPPAGSRLPITYVDILRAVKRGEDADERAQELLCIEHAHASLPE